MFCNAGFIEPHCPGSIEMLTSQDAALGVGSSIRSGWDIDDQSSETDGVVVGHCCLVSERDSQVTLFGADLSEKTSRLFRRLCETTVEAGQKVRFDPLIGLIDFGDSFQGHFGNQAILERAALAFDTSFGLSRVGGDDLDAQFLEDSPDMCGETTAGKFFFVAPVVVVSLESAMAILVDRGGDSVASENHIKQPEIANGILSRPEQYP